MCGMTLSYVWYDSCTVAQRHSGTERNRFQSMYVTWLSTTEDLPRLHACHGSFIYYDMTHSYVSQSMYVTWLSTTGWRRLIGSPKLQVIFHKRATKYRALLRKMTYKDKGSYECSPPCRQDLPRLHAWHGSFIYYDMAHSYVWHDSCTRAHIHSWIQYNRFERMYVTLLLNWPIYTRAMTDLYAWHDSFICVTWLMHRGLPSYTAQSFSRNVCDIVIASCTRVPWPIRICAMTHSYVWHDSCTGTHVHSWV